MLQIRFQGVSKCNLCYKRQCKSWSWSAQHATVVNCENGKVFMGSASKVSDVASVVYGVRVITLKVIIKLALSFALFLYLQHDAIIYFLCIYSFLRNLPSITAHLVMTSPGGFQNKLFRSPRHPGHSQCQSLIIHYILWCSSTRKVESVHGDVARSVLLNLHSCIGWNKVEGIEYSWSGDAHVLYHVSMVKFSRTELIISYFYLDQ